MACVLRASSMFSPGLGLYSGLVVLRFFVVFGQGWCDLEAVLYAELPAHHYGFFGLVECVP